MDKEPKYLSLFFITVLELSCFIFIESVVFQSWKASFKDLEIYKLGIWPAESTYKF